MPELEKRDEVLSKDADDDVLDLGKELMIDMAKDDMNEELLLQKNADMAKDEMPELHMMIHDVLAKDEKIRLLPSNTSSENRSHKSHKKLVDLTKQVHKQGPAFVLGGVVGGVGAHHVGKARKLRQQLKRTNQTLILLRGMLTAVKPKATRQRMMTLVNGIIRSQHPEHFRKAHDKTDDS